MDDFEQLKNDIRHVERIILARVSKAARLYTAAGDRASDSEITEYWQVMDDATRHGQLLNAMLARLSDFDLTDGG